MYLKQIILLKIEIKLFFSSLSCTNVYSWLTKQYLIIIIYSNISNKINMYLKQQQQAKY